MLGLSVFDRGGWDVNLKIDFLRFVSKTMKLLTENFQFYSFWKKVQVGKDQEKAQSEKDSHSKNRGGKKPN